MATAERDYYEVLGVARTAGDDEIKLAEAYRGPEVQVPLQVAVACERCRGSGAEPGTSPVTCLTCGGAGRVQQVSQSVFGQFVRASSCPRCRGSGVVVETPCER